MILATPSASTRSVERPHPQGKPVGTVCRCGSIASFLEERSELRLDSVLHIPSLSTRLDRLLFRKGRSLPLPIPRRNRIPPSPTTPFPEGSDSSAGIGGCSIPASLSLSFVRVRPVRWRTPWCGPPPGLPSPTCPCRPPSLPVGEGEGGRGGPIETTSPEATREPNDRCIRHRRVREQVRKRRRRLLGWMEREGEGSSR